MYAFAYAYCLQKWDFYSQKPNRLLEDCLSRLPNITITPRNAHTLEYLAGSRPLSAVVGQVELWSPPHQPGRCGIMDN